MKKYNNLWNKVCTIENFKQAYKNAIKGKRYYTEVKEIEKYGVDKYLLELLEEVVQDRYVVSEYTVFHRFTGGKDREIFKLPMKDRIILHALMNIIEPLFRKSFIIDTFSSIKGRGIHQGLKRIKNALKNEDVVYYLKLDIKKCYPSLDKNILKEKLHKKFKDKNIQWLLDIIIDSCEKGVPIGNYTSQYFNNFYFNDFDHWIKEVKGVKYYYRYCDDMIIIDKTKEKLHALFEEIRLKIKELNVTLKDNYQIYNIDKRSVDFIGYKIRRDYTLVRKHTKKTFIQKVSSMDLNNLHKRDANVLGSYWGIFCHADCRNLWYKYIGMKTFKDLNISVYKRGFVRYLIDVPIFITSSTVYDRKGTQWLKFKCNIDNEHKNIIVSTSGKLLVEAGKKMKSSMYPFKTTIIINNKGFYEFT